MRVDVLELHDHLSHASTRVEFNGARMATISGPNGAGKSALLESIKYVLFDDGRAKGDDLVRLGATDMSVSVTFSLNGTCYRATRGRTRRSGGHSNLDLLVETPDGTWRPLTGDDIRSTQARIVELIGMDAATFATSVFLSQGEANRFADSTPAERKRVLGQVLGLDIYARAEAHARDLARDLDARAALERDRIERLSSAIAEFGEAEADRDQAAGILEATTSEISEIGDRRSAAEARLTELAGELAVGAAAEAEVSRLSEAIAAQRQAIDELERPHERAYAAWWARQGAADDRVAELEAHGKAGTSVCEACGQAIRQDTALEQLAAARARSKAIATEEPKRPLAIDREKASLMRLEGRRRDLAWGDSDIALGLAQTYLAEAERRAARGEAIVGARLSLEAATTAKAEATAELAKIQAAGETLAVALTAAKVNVAGLAGLRDEQAQLQRQAAGIRAELDVLEHGRRVAERVLANTEANLERRAALTAEHGALCATTAAAAAELGILRQLVTAFGVTGIPARVIESVIPELEGYANQLLAELRPGMDLAIRAQRAKKDGKGLIEALDLVVRDAAGERPLAMFSGGERMSVSLAIAVALSRLVARRAGAAIRSLVVDEPDGLDAEARRAFGQALRVLAHQGELERVVLVSHHEDLAEYGDATYRVTKNGGGSLVEQV